MKSNWPQTLWVVEEANLELLLSLPQGCDCKYTTTFPLQLLLGVLVV